MLEYCISRNKQVNFFCHVNNAEGHPRPAVLTKLTVGKLLSHAMATECCLDLGGCLPLPLFRLKERQRSFATQCDSLANLSGK